MGQALSLEMARGNEKVLERIQCEAEVRVSVS